MKRLFGDDADAVEVPGMEIDTISKYGINILIDFKPGDEPIRKDVAAEINAAQPARLGPRLRSRAACRRAFRSRRCSRR